jgi:hypothetical protein
MANNLFVAYDLMNLGKNYEGVRDAIKSLGRWYQFQFSLFYVNTPHSAAEAHAIVRAAMDADDRLCVIEATGGRVSSYALPDIDAVNFVWQSP